MVETDSHQNGGGNLLAWCLGAWLILTLILIITQPLEGAGFFSKGFACYPLTTHNTPFGARILIILIFHL